MQLRTTIPFIPQIRSRSTSFQSDMRPPSLKKPAAPAAETSKPDLQSLVTAYDFEEVAHKTFSRKAWASVSSAAADCITDRHLNPGIFSRIILRPRILRDVGRCEIKTHILGLKTTAPFFIAPTAMQKPVHPLGETELSRGAGAAGLIHCISSSSSFPLADIRATAMPGQHHFLQLYTPHKPSRGWKLKSRTEEGSKLFALSEQRESFFMASISEE